MWCLTAPGAGVVPGGHPRRVHRSPVGELSALRWDDIDEASGRIRVVRGNWKGRERPRPRPARRRSCRSLPQIKVATRNQPPAPAAVRGELPQLDFALLASSPARASVQSPSRRPHPLQTSPANLAPLAGHKVRVRVRHRRASCVVVWRPKSPAGEPFGLPRTARVRGSLAARMRRNHREWDAPIPGRREVAMRNHWVCTAALSIVMSSACVMNAGEDDEVDISDPTACAASAEESDVQVGIAVDCAPGGQDGSAASAPPPALIPSTACQTGRSADLHTGWADCWHINGVRNTGKFRVAVLFCTTANCGWAYGPCTYIDGSAISSKTNNGAWIASPSDVRATDWMCPPG
jgi:hypothetical protein